MSAEHHAATVRLRTLLAELREYDRLAAYVLDHGRPFAPAPRPRGVRKRADKACFLNALRYVVEPSKPDALYVEGFALGALEEPVHHAWVAEPGSDIAIDLTWREPSTAYVGVAFTAEDAAKLAVEVKVWGGALPLLALRGGGAASP